MTFGKFYWLYLFFILGNISYAQSLHLMTYNIRLDVASDGLNAWPYRKDFLSSQIQFYEPDILGIQEAMPHQVVDLQQLLSQYSQVGIGREGLGKGESSNIFYKKEKLRVIETNTFWLSDIPNEISIGWDAACNRVCTFALFEEISSNKKWFVFNTHLDHMGEQARTNGIALIMDKIGQYNIHNYPVVLMGDFNLEPQDKRILDIKKKMNDVSEIATIKPFGPIGTFNNFDFNTTVTKRIDYIFISKNNQLKVKKYAVLSDSKDLRYPSDHLPVFVEISFEE
jgi:endonuclease/exonuclease/phosphatase family metal-dependent hydrolase